MDRLTALLRLQPALVVRLALAHCKTRDGAMRVYFAEKHGRARPGVLRAAERRIAELQGQEPETAVPLVAQGIAIDQDRRQWEHQKLIVEPRIVEAVGRGRRSKWW